jgi:hypothetical protein
MSRGLGPHPYREVTRAAASSPRPLVRRRQYLPRRGATGGIQTHDLNQLTALLYQLSYGWLLNIIHLPIASSYTDHRPTPLARSSYHRPRRPASSQPGASQRKQLRHAPSRAGKPRAAVAAYGQALISRYLKQQSLLQDSSQQHLPAQPDCTRQEYPACSPPTFCCQ